LIVLELLFVFQSQPGDMIDKFRIDCVLKNERVKDRFHHFATP
jgi:hypothetical protein